MDAEDVLGWLGVIACGCALFLIVFFALADKPVVRYNLGSQSGGLTISVDVDCFGDNTILLDRSITYERAIAIVDSLNAELVRHPRLK